MATTLIKYVFLDDRGNSQESLTPPAEGIEYTVITEEVPEPSPILSETQKYLKRQSDGMQMYFSITAELRVLQSTGAITREQNRAIEDALNPVRDEIVLGQWRTALEKLEEIGTADGIVSQQMYDRFHLIISTYLDGPMYQL
jgi:hypothetical protein